ncbi:Ig-like domain-containing protein [Candidatus Daviesbacteria bacterium]|nr:Ig-like domain-containing protein [Candidatus Daviesbacteria bacterium]
MYMPKLNERGAVPILIIVAAVGVVAFIAISQTASFRDRIFSQLFSKPSSYAISEPIDSIRPRVSITSPLDGSTVTMGSTLNITASATDNVGVSKVEFYIGNRLVCTDTTSPYNCSSVVPTRAVTSYSTFVVARAYDAANNTGQHRIKLTAVK